MSPLTYEEYPKKADLRRDVFQPLPIIPPGTVDATTLDGTKATEYAMTCLDVFNFAVDSNDTERLTQCFCPDNAFWRDAVALTAHLRTFQGPGKIANAFIETKRQRGVLGGLTLEGSAHFISATPTLQFIQCVVAFRTSSPAATCHGRLLLLPSKTQSEDGSGILTWKIWVLYTMIENLQIQPEDDSLLSNPKRIFEDVEVIETDVLIVGGGNAGITLAARLKALNVDYLVIEKNPSVGDNWAFRYDCLQFHIPTFACEMPFRKYAEHAQHPNRLYKKDLVDHLKQYVAALNLNVINSVTIQATGYDPAKKIWTVEVMTKDGPKSINCKQFVQATGFNSGKPHIPQLKDAHLYQSTNIHSVKFKNARELVNKGIESAVIVGSANTAFDVMEDCHKAGLQITMIASLGLYNLIPIEAADKSMLTLPAAVEGPLAHGLFAHLSSTEPDRYKSVAEAGFPIYDSRHPEASVQHHLSERGGGHYVDVGEAIDLISQGKVTVRGNVQPVAYTESGLRLSDGSTVDADAIIWCTGFADGDARGTAAEILNNPIGQADGQNELLGPQDVAARLDGSFGFDAEGEIRGMWKRHLRMENYWLMGGNTVQQRWWSRILAQQIKMALVGILPPAYRDTP